jgi:hypothetical protein
MQLKHGTQSTRPGPGTDRNSTAYAKLDGLFTLLLYLCSGSRAERGTDFKYVVGRGACTGYRRWAVMKAMLLICVQWQLESERVV